MMVHGVLTKDELVSSLQYRNRKPTSWLGSLATALCCFFPFSLAWNTHLDNGTNTMFIGARLQLSYPDVALVQIIVGETERRGAGGHCFCPNRDTLI